MLQTVLILIVLILIVLICAVKLAYSKGKEYTAKKILRAIDKAEYNRETSAKDLKSLVDKLIKHME